MFELRVNDMRTEVINCFEAGLVPIITSSPGVGKSTLAHQIADDYNLELIDLRLSMCAPEDLMGLPMRIDKNGVIKATFASFDMFPTVDTPLPVGKVGWLLLLDEFNSALRSVQAAAYKIILDRYVGQAKLHESVFIIAAGNLATDKAIVNSMSTAMQSRLIHLELMCHHGDWMKHAIASDFDHRVTGFLEFRPELLMDFRPDHQDKTFACPRTWEFTSRLIKGKEVANISLALLAGTVSTGVGKDFHSFLHIYESLPSYQSILTNPTNASLPTDPGVSYALTSMLLNKLDEKEFPDIAKFVNRMSAEFQVIYFRGVVSRKPKMRGTPEYAKSILNLTEFLHDESDDHSTAAA